MKNAYEGLHVLVDDNPVWDRDPIVQAEAACAGGAAVVQLRAKRAPDKQTSLWARTLREMTLAAGIRFVVNDRFDIALDCGADAVHLGQDDIAPEEVRRHAGNALQIGRSTHSLEEAIRALEEPIDYVAFGPVFATASKDSPYAPRGIASLAEVVREVTPLPVVAIGGVELAHVEALTRAGARGIAVISQVAGAPDPKSAVRELACALGTPRVARR